MGAGTTSTPDALLPSPCFLLLLPIHGAWPMDSGGAISREPLIREEEPMDLTPAVRRPVISSCPTTLTPSGTSSEDAP